MSILLQTSGTFDDVTNANTYVIRYTLILGGGGAGKFSTFL